MKNKRFFWFLLVCAFTVVSFAASAQCSICTRTAQQLGEKPAQNLNAGILYLAFAPFLIVGWVAYRFWKNQKG